MFGYDALLESIHQSVDCTDLSFYTAFTDFYHSNPTIQAYVGPCKVIFGSGWTLNIQKTYGLTLKGIERFFSLKKLAIPVLRNPCELEGFIAKAAEGSSVAVASQESFNPSSNEDLHVFAILLEKKKDLCRLYLFDSNDSSFEIAPFLSLPRTEIYFPDKGRQTRAQANCYAFAIHDALLLEKKITAQRQDLLTEKKIPCTAAIFDCLKAGLHLFSCRRRSIKQDPHFKTEQFKLGLEFFYQATPIKKDLLTLFIQLALGKLNGKESCSFERSLAIQG